MVSVRVTGLATAGGFSAAAQGALHLGAKPAPTGSLQFKTSAADFRPLRRTLTGQPGAGFATRRAPSSALPAPICRSPTWSSTPANRHCTGGSISNCQTRSAIGGDVAADDVDAAAIAGMLLGLPSVAPNAAKPWSAAPVGAGAFGRGERRSELQVRPRRADAGFDRTRPQRRRAVPVAGNRVERSRRQTGRRTSHGRADLPARSADFRRARSRRACRAPTPQHFIASNSNAIDGVLTVKLQGESQGTSPEPLSGPFTAAARSRSAGRSLPVSIRRRSMSRSALADQSGTIDAPKIRAAVSAAMDNGRLMVPKGEAEVTIAAGQIHLSNAKLQAQGGARTVARWRSRPQHRGRRCAADAVATTRG